MNAEIFLVDANPNNLTLLLGILREAGFQVRVSDRGRRAIQMIRARSPELVLLDITMPDMNGYEVCQELRADPRTAGIPVLFISANDDPLDKVRAFGVGGVDYIPKPFQAEEVIARVRNHLSIVRLRKALEERTASLEEALRELAEASLTDPLTGLRNRRFLVQRIAGLAAADLTFFLIDIDHFKRVNDLHGHAAGDSVLQLVASRLREVFPPTDHLVRWGGEEFLAVTCDGSRARGPEIAERIRARMANEAFALDEHLRESVTCSVGFASLPFFPGYPQAMDWQDVVRLADLGLYAAKEAGRNRWVGLCAGERVSGPEVIARVKSDPREAERLGELRFLTSVKDLEAV